MQAEQLDTLYAALAGAIDRIGEEGAALLLATLALDLIAHHADGEAVAAAIARAERLAAS